MTDYYVYSTLTASQRYTNYQPGGGDLPIAAGEVFIAGGANIPDKYLRTPDGSVVTKVSEEQMEVLNANEVFQMHMKNGFIRVSDHNEHPEVVAADMETRDQSAPLVDQDFEPDQAPVTNAPTSSKTSRKA